MVRTHSAIRFAVAFHAAVSVLACGNPIAPVPLGEGIILYEDKNYGRYSEALNRDVRDLEFQEGPCLRGGADHEPSSNWGDCISSVRVNPGWTATFYSDDSYKGRSFTATADLADLDAVPGPCRGTFNDCISSIKVSRVQ